MNAVISNRLWGILPRDYTEVKLDGKMYYGKLKLNIKQNMEFDHEVHFDVTEFNYFCYNKKNKITCWPLAKGDQPLSETRQWKTEGRQEIKPGKFLKMFEENILCEDDQSDSVTTEMTVKIRARLCEIFADSLRATNIDIQFEIGDDIQSVYEIYHHSDSHYLKNSCMRHQSEYGCRNYSGFYNEIPGLKIIHNITGGTLLFRALLWECETEEGEKIKFLDRIYGSEAVNNKLIEYAQEQEWAWRSFGNCTVFYKGNFTNVKCKIPLKAFEYLEQEGSPYVDTLCRLNKRGDEWWLSNYLCNYDYSLTECDGGAVTSRYSCYECGDSIAEDGIWEAHGDRYCQHCYNSRFTECEHCGEVMDNDDRIEVAYSNRYTYLCRHCARQLGYRECVQCNEWHDDCISYEGDHWCPDCFDEYFIECEVCEEKHYQSRVFGNDPNCGGATVTVDGKEITICEDCLAELWHCKGCSEYFSKALDDNKLCPTCAKDVNLVIRQQLERENVTERRHAEHIANELKYQIINEIQREPDITYQPTVVSGYISFDMEGNIITND